MKQNLLKYWLLILLLTASWSIAFTKPKLKLKTGDTGLLYDVYVDHSLRGSYFVVFHGNTFEARCFELSEQDMFPFFAHEKSGIFSKGVQIREVKFDQDSCTVFSKMGQLPQEKQRLLKYVKPGDTVIANQNWDIILSFPAKPVVTLESFLALSVAREDKRLYDGLALELYEKSIGNIMIRSNREERRSNVLQIERAVAEGSWEPVFEIAFEHKFGGTLNLPESVRSVKDKWEMKLMQGGKIDFISFKPETILGPRVTKLVREVSSDCEILGENIQWKAGASFVSAEANVRLKIPQPDWSPAEKLVMYLRDKCGFKQRDNWFSKRKINISEDADHDLTASIDVRKVCAVEGWKWSKNDGVFIEEKRVENVGVNKLRKFASKPGKPALFQIDKHQHLFLNGKVLKRGSVVALLKKVLSSEDPKWENVKLKYEKNKPLPEVGQDPDSCLYSFSGSLQVTGLLKEKVANKILRRKGLAYIVGHKCFSDKLFKLVYLKDGYICLKASGQQVHSTVRGAYRKYCLSVVQKIESRSHWKVQNVKKEKTGIYVANRTISESSVLKTLISGTVISSEAVLRSSYKLDNDRLYLPILIK